MMSVVSQATRRRLEGAAVRSCGREPTGAVVVSSAARDRVVIGVRRCGGPAARGESRRVSVWTVAPRPLAVFANQDWCRINRAVARPTGSATALA